MDTINDRLGVIIKTLDEYENKIGLPPPEQPGKESELQQYFLMPRDQIEKLNSQECGVISYRLAQYVIYIQRLYNRENSKISWAKSILNDILAKEYNNYSQYIKFEMKVAMIAQENDIAHKLQLIIENAQQRMDRLYMISSHIKYLSDVLLANQRIKQMNKNEQYYS